MVFYSNSQYKLFHPFYFLQSLADLLCLNKILVQFYKPHTKLGANSNLVI